jgi:hypothetical protein
MCADKQCPYLWADVLCVQVLRDLVTVIRPSVQNSLLTGWKRRFLLRLDGVQQQVQTPAICNLATGMC